MQQTTYELKYCERCGSLLLRRQKSSETYCGPCQQALSNILFPGNSGPARWGDGPRRRCQKILLQPRVPRGFQAAWQSNLLAGRVQ